MIANQNKNHNKGFIHGGFLNFSALSGKGKEKIVSPRRKNPPAGSEGVAEGPPSLKLRTGARGVGEIPPRPSADISTPPLALKKQNAESKIFFSFYLPAEASAQAGKKKSGARKSKNVKKILLEAVPTAGRRSRRFAAARRRSSISEILAKIGSSVVV